MTPAGRASPTTSPPPTAAQTATAPTGSTSRPPPTPQRRRRADDLGWTTAGQWFKYTVNVATAGTYTLGFRVAVALRGSPTRCTSPTAAGTNLSGSVARAGHRRVPDLGHGHRQRHAARGRPDAESRPGQQRLEPATSSLRLDRGRRDSTPPGEAPYGGTAAAVPGTVQAENYDTGGQGVAYNVTAVNGSANSYRSDGVDLEATTDSGGGYDVGWTATGQWFKYTVNVATAGTYTLEPAAGRAHRRHQRAADRQRGRDRPDRGHHRAGHRRLADLDDGDGEHHPAGRPADPDRRPGQPRLEHQLPGVRYLRRRGTGGSYGGFPAGFWGNTSSIPSASGAIEFDFINATNGEYPDSEVYWSVNGVTESIAQSPYYEMTSCGSCRINFYLGSPTSSYHDFIELNSSGTTINADTSRVDAFGLPLAIHLHNSDGSDTVVGENDSVFAESRTALFPQFENYVPAAFKQLATVNAPYNIPSRQRRRGVPAGRRRRQLHDLVRGLGGRHRDHPGGLRLPGRGKSRPQRRPDPVLGAEPLRGAVLDDGAEHAV